MALIDLTLSNARQFYSSIGNPLGVQGLSCDLKDTIELEHLISKGRLFYNFGAACEKERSPKLF